MLALLAEEMKVIAISLVVMLSSSRKRVKKVFVVEIQEIPSCAPSFSLFPHQFLTPRTQRDNNRADSEWNFLMRKLFSVTLLREEAMREIPFASRIFLFFSLRWIFITIVPSAMIGESLGINLNVNGNSSLFARINSAARRRLCCII